MPTEPLSTHSEHRIGAKLQVDHVSVSFDTPNGSILAVNDVTLAVEDGEFVCILGPSGCGKTTLLRCVMGLEHPTAGQILLDGKNVSGPGPDRGMVFQSPRLLPWRTVLSNVMFGLQVQKVDKQLAEKASLDAIRLVGLEGREQQLPRQLSGGMQQRVNLARALVIEPSLLLLDEPFAALDAQTRETMQEELVRIWAETKNTSIFITHQISEALYLADKVVVMDAHPGRIRTVLEVELPRPRVPSVKRTRQFHDYEDYLRDQLQQAAGR